MFHSCVLSSHLSTSSPTQGHTTHGAGLISWEIQVATSDCVWATSYVWSNGITTSHLTPKLGYTDEICLAYNILSGNDVVIKLEQVEGKVRTLGGEFHVYTKLKGGTSIPHVHWFGRESGFDVIVVNHLGQSLEDLFVQCHFKFTIKTVSLLAGQLVRAFDF